MPSLLNGRGYFSAKRQSIVNTDLANLRVLHTVLPNHVVPVQVSVTSYAYLRYLLLVLSYSLFFNEHSPSFWLLKQLSKLPYSTTTHPTHRPHTPFSPFRQNLRDLGKSLHPPASRALGKGHAGSTYSNLCTVCASRRSFSNDRVISTVHQVLDLGGSATKTGERALIRCEICAEQTLQCAPDAPSCMFIILMSPQETRVTYNSQRYTPHMYTFSRLE